MNESLFAGKWSFSGEIVDGQPQVVPIRNACPSTNCCGLPPTPFNRLISKSTALTAILRRGWEMVVKSINCWASGTYNVEVNSNNPHEAGLLKLDITKATTELNWKPVLNAQTAVELTINWYKNFYNNTSVTELMESDIKYYQSKINE